jgi:hypothetical protein
VDARLVTVQVSIEHLPEKSSAAVRNQPSRPKYSLSVASRNTVRYLGIEVDDALTIAEQVDV